MTVVGKSRVDRTQLKALLRAYFIMSTRSMPVGITGAKRARTLPIILGVYGLLGFVSGAMAPLFPSVFVYSVMMHTMTLFVVGTMALNEASEVLFNSRDGDILNFRPVHASTLVLAKGLTLLGFCALMALSLNVGPCALGGLAKDAHPWFAAVHLASVALETVFVCAAVVFAHGVIVRVLGTERFQRFVTAAQVASTLLFIAGFQVLPRVANKLDVAFFEKDWNPVWWLPSTWFAAIDGLLAGTAGPSGLLVPALIGVGATLGLAWFGVLRLPGAVVRSAREESRPAKPVDEARVGTKMDPRPRVVRYEGRMWKAWMPDPIERAIFRLCVTQFKRDRSLKVRLAAGLAYFLVLPIIFAIDHRSASSTSGSLYISWLCAIIPLSALEFLRISAVPDSSELFLFTPIPEPSALLHGSRKAALLFIVLPILAYTLAIGLWASRSNPNAFWLALPPLFLVHPMSMVPGWRGDYIPFSQAPRTGERSAQVLGMFLGMIPLGILCAIVVVADGFGLVVPAVLFVATVAVVIHVVFRGWIRKRSRNVLKR